MAIPLRLSYEDSKRVIQDLPMTWIPALLQEMVITACRKKVFLRGRICVFVQQQEMELDNREPPAMIERAKLLETEERRLPSGTRFIRYRCRVCDLYWDVGPTHQEMEHHKPKCPLVVGLKTTPKQK